MIYEYSRDRRKLAPTPEDTQVNESSELERAYHECEITLEKFITMALQEIARKMDTPGSHTHQSLLLRSATSPAGQSSYFSGLHSSPHDDPPIHGDRSSHDEIKHKLLDSFGFTFATQKLLNLLVGKQMLNGGRTFDTQPRWSYTSKDLNLLTQKGEISKDQANYIILTAFSYMPIRLILNRLQLLLANNTKINVATGFEENYWINLVGEIQFNLGYAKRMTKALEAKLFEFFPKLPPETSEMDVRNIINSVLFLKPNHELSATILRSQIFPLLSAGDLLQAQQVLRQFMTEFPRDFTFRSLKNMGFDPHQMESHVKERLISDASAKLEIDMDTDTIAKIQAFIDEKVVFLTKLKGENGEFERQVRVVRIEYVEKNISYIDEKGKKRYRRVSIPYGWANFRSENNEMGPKTLKMHLHKILSNIAGGDWVRVEQSTQK